MSRRPRRRRKPGCSKACGKPVPICHRRAGLVDSLTAIRQGRVLRSGQKVLLVLDQFEQWLHAHRGEENTELVAALRQCDGEHVQAVVMVRDDFWLAASRFMADLEVELVQGQNTALVDLFDPRHARKVLTAFGTAYGNLPGADGRHLQGPARLSGSSDHRACPGRQGHLGAARPVRRDGQGQALDPGNLAGGRRHRGRGRHLPGGDVQFPSSQSRSIASTRKRLRRF